MPTDKQLAASRANAVRSTGPRTPEGKTRSAQNARKHSFAGVSFAIVKIEDREAVDRLRHDLIEVFQPANSQETFAIERIALAQHNLLRIPASKPDSTPPLSIKPSLTTTLLSSRSTRNSNRLPSKLANRIALIVSPMVSTA